MAKEQLKINIPDDCGWTALMGASMNGRLDIVENLIKQGADVNIKNSNRETALILASRCGYLEIVKCLIENKADIDVQDELGATALIWASGGRYLEIVKYLIENGADVNIKNNKNETALIKVIISCIKTFEENKDDMTKKHAALNRCFKIVKCLIENGADVNIKNNEGKTALDLAEENGYKEIVEILKSVGAKHGNEIQ